MNNESTKTEHFFSKKFGRKVLFCLLFVAIVFVFIIAHSKAGVDKKDPFLQNEAFNSVGVVKGILHNGNNPTVLIGIELFHEGETVAGATVVKIHKDRVDFKKDGFSWTQCVMEKPE
jgi:hypothetical protein